MPATTAWLRRMTGGALIAGLALAGSVAGASGQVPLTPKRSVDPLPVGLAFDASGRAVASWRAFTGPLDEGRLRHYFAVTDRAGRRRRPVTLPATILVHDLAVTGRRAALVTWREKPAGRRHLKSVIKLVIADTASGTVRRVRTLAVGPPRRIMVEGTPSTLSEPRVAATPDGALVVAWVRSSPHRLAGLWVSTIRDGKVGRPRRLGPFGGSPMLEIARDGSGLLAWRRGHRIQTRVRHTNGRWGSIELAATTIGAVTWGLESLDVAAGGGQYAVAMLQTARSMAGVRLWSTGHVRVARGVWRSGVLGDLMFKPDVDTTYVTDLPRVRTFVTTDGRLHAAWPALAGSRAGVTAATLVPTAGSVVATMPVALTPATSHAALEDAAAGPDGSFAVAWYDTSTGSGTQSVAEVDSAGAVRTTTGVSTRPALRGAKVAYHPRSGRPMLLWCQGTPQRGYRPVVLSIPASPR